MQAICSIAYNLSKQGIGNEELIEESLSNILGDPPIEELIEESANNDLTKGSTAERPVEESIEESAGPLSTEEVMEYIRRAYPSNNIVQRIMASKAAGHQKIPLDLIKQGIYIELGDCEIHNAMLYINRKLYVPKVDDTRTKVLQTIYKTPSTSYARRTSTYLRTSLYYY